MHFVDHGSDLLLGNYIDLDNRRTWCTAGLCYHRNSCGGCSNREAEERHLTIQFRRKRPSLLDYRLLEQGAMQALWRHVPLCPRPCTNTASVCISSIFYCISALFHADHVRIVCSDVPMIQVTQHSLLQRNPLNMMDCLAVANEGGTASHIVMPKRKRLLAALHLIPLIDIH
jgi:hypothetical protein